MNYSPKLKMAMEEIKIILHKHDIGALVVLHTPGYSEYLAKLNPGYSCVKIQPEGGMRIRAKLEDFNGDVSAREKKIADTSNMFRLLTDTMTEMVYPIHEISDKIDAIIGAEHTPGIKTDHTVQNN